MAIMELVNASWPEGAAGSGGAGGGKSSKAITLRRQGHTDGSCYNNTHSHRNPPAVREVT